MVSTRKMGDIMRTVMLKVGTGASVSSSNNGESKQLPRFDVDVDITDTTIVIRLKEVVWRSIQPKPRALNIAISVVQLYCKQIDITAVYCADCYIVDPQQNKKATPYLRLTMSISKDGEVAIKVQKGSIGRPYHVDYLA
jgi:hypothetical protein